MPRTSDTIRPLLLLLAVFAALLGSLRADLAHDIAQRTGGRYKGSPTQGDLYAEQLYQAFTRNGIEAYLLQFEWRQGGAAYAASFVVFRDGTGRYFGQSSTSLSAKWLSGRSPEQWVRGFCAGMDVTVRSAISNGDEIARAVRPSLPAPAPPPGTTSAAPVSAPAETPVAAAPASPAPPAPETEAVASPSIQLRPPRPALVPVSFDPGSAPEAAPPPAAAAPAAELARADNAVSAPPMSASQPDSAAAQDQRKPEASSDLSPPDLSTLPPPTNAPPAPADSEDPMVNLLNLLQQRGVISQGDSAILIKQAQAKAFAVKAQTAQAAPSAAPAASDGKDVVHVTYVPPAVRSQIAQEVRDQVMTEARNENWANPRSFPGWLSRITLFGDVRVRFEGDFFPSNNAIGLGSPFWNMNALNTGAPYDFNPTLNASNPPYYNNDQNRDRVRLRSRFGLDSDLGDGFSGGFRIATGQDDSPVSENQSLGYANNGQGGNFSKYAIWLDRAFLTYDIGRTVENDLSFTVGRFDNPFFGTTMIWADDLGFDGFAAKGRFQAADGVRPFATAGVFPVYNTDFNFSTTSATKFHSEDKWLYGFQLGTDWKINDDFSLKVASSLYWFQDIEGKVSSPFTPLSASDQGDTDGSRPAFAQRGNSYIALRDIVPPTGFTTGTYNQWQYFGLATPYHEAAVTARLDYSHFDPFHLWLIGEGVKNIAFNRAAIEGNGPNDPNGTTLLGPVNNNGAGSFDGGDTAWIVSFNVGSPVLQKRWDWNVGLSYRYVESDAVVDGFCDSDFGGGGTNLKGFTLGGNVAFSPRVWLGLRWMSSDSIAGPRFDEDLVQFDINAKF